MPHAARIAWICVCKTYSWRAPPRRAHTYSESSSFNCSPFFISFFCSYLSLSLSLSLCPCEFTASVSSHLPPASRRQRLSWRTTSVLCVGVLSDWFRRSYCQLVRPYIQCGAEKLGRWPHVTQKAATALLSVTSPNDDRFSKLFYTARLRLVIKSSLILAFQTLSLWPILQPINQRTHACSMSTWGRWKCRNKKHGRAETACSEYGQHVIQLPSRHFWSSCVFHSCVFSVNHFTCVSAENVEAV